MDKKYYVTGNGRDVRKPTFARYWSIVFLYRWIYMNIVTFFRIVITQVALTIPRIP